MAPILKNRISRQAAGNVQLAFDPTGRDEPRLLSLPVRLIDTDPNQPRKHLGHLADLALSIREHGVLQPLIVEAVEGVGGGRYRLLVGERRLAACRSLQLETVPCIVRTVVEQSRLALQLIENLHRQDLHPIEEAQALKRLREECHREPGELARQLGKSRSSICETLRILELAPQVLADVRTSEHARKSVLLEIAKEPDPVRQQALWEREKAGQLTARQAKQERQKHANGKSPGSTHTIRLDDATVTIRFASGTAGPDRLRGVLESALQQTSVSPGGTLTPPPD